MCVIIHKLYGIEPTLEMKLKSRGIKDSEDLLQACRTPREVAELAQSSGVEISILMKLLHRAELARIRGIGETYTMLLEEAGVNTARDLAAAAPDDLRARLTRINTDKKLVGRVPAQAMVNACRVLSSDRRRPVAAGSTSLAYLRQSIKKQRGRRSSKWNIGSLAAFFLFV
jgi:predicted flap endonuclease-1-like 5' DNA nuclease